MDGDLLPGVLFLLLVICGPSVALIFGTGVWYVIDKFFGSRKERSDG